MSETSKIEIRHSGRSTLAGQQKVFESDRVRLGRRAENDVVFDPIKDALVSGAHAEVRREGDRLVVQDLGSSNGTFVNGKRINAATPLHPGDVVSLGQGGPEFSVSIPGAAAAAAPPPPAGVSATIVAPVRPKPAQAVPSVKPFVQSPAQKAPERPADAGRVQPVARAGATSPSSAPPKAIGMNTLMRVVSSATAKERKKTTAIAAVLATVLAVGVGLAVYFSIPRPGETPVGPSLPTSQEIQRKVAGSTYVVMSRYGPNQKFSPLGTAWSVKEGLMATNCHVAEIFNEVGPNGEVIVRRHTASGAEPSDLRITGVTFHPGYERFQKLIEEYDPYSPSANAFLKRLITPYDVALMTVHEDDKTKQAPPIPLLPESEVAKIEGGQIIHSAGFPLEGMALQDWDKPAATSFASQVSRINDELGSAADPKVANMLMYQFTAIGGQSGSCVVDEQGRAIGFVSAINAVASVAGRDAVGGTCYGPRVDILHELLNGTAEARQAERDQTLRTRIAQAFKNGVEDPKDIGSFILSEGLKSLKPPAGFSDWKFEGTSSGTNLKLTKGQTWTSTKIKMPKSGHGTIVLVASDHRAKLVGSATFARSTFDNSTTLDLLHHGRYYNGISFTLGSPDEFEISLTLDRTSEIDEVEFAVVFYHFIPE